MHQSSSPVPADNPRPGKAGNRVKDLEAGVGDLSPSQYIETRHFLNDVHSAIRGLSDPRPVCLR